MAFTDGRARAVGATGQLHPRSSMSLVNVAYNNAFNWSDPSVHSLEEQALKPMFSTNPVELGVVKADLLRLIRSDATYRALFPQAFPGEANAFTIGNVAKAIASFERTIVSAGSAYDRFHFLNETNAIPNPPSAASSCFSWTTAALRAFGAMAVSISATQPEALQSSFTTPGCITWPGRYRIQLRISAFTSVPGARPMSENSRRPRCATSR